MLATERFEMGSGSNEVFIYGDTLCITNVLCTNALKWTHPRVGCELHFLTICSVTLSVLYCTRSMDTDTGNVKHVMYLYLYVYLDLYVYLYLHLYLNLYLHLYLYLHLHLYLYVYLYVYLHLYLYLYLSHSSSCVLNFILPICTLNVAQSAHTSGPGVTGSVDTYKTQRAFTNPLKTMRTVETFGIIFREVHHLKPKEPEEFEAVCKLKLLAFSLLCSSSRSLRANLKSKYLTHGLYLKLPQDVSACVTTKITT